MAVHALLRLNFDALGCRLRGAVLKCERDFEVVMLT